MRQGTPVIVNGLLPSIDGRSGAPDLLVAVADGYVPVDIKSHKALKKATKGNARVSRLSDAATVTELAGTSELGNHWVADTFQLVHYSRMLQSLGHASGDLRAGIIGRDNLTEQFGDELGIVWYQLDELQVPTYSKTSESHRTKRDLIENYDHEFGFRMEVAKAAASGGELVLPIGTDACVRCDWTSVCKEYAGPDDPSFAINIGRLSQREWLFLYEHGGRTLQGLAEIDVASLAEEFTKHAGSSGNPIARLTNIVRRARMTTAKVSFEPLSNWGEVEIPAADVEIDFDIEWDSSELIYQWGLSVRTNQGKAEYVPGLVDFGAFDEAAEARLADKFTRALQGILDRAKSNDQSVAIYHWSHPEVSRTKKFAAAHGLITGESRNLDLCKWYTGNFFPLDGASLKTVAPLFGFAWDVPEEEAGGFNSLQQIEEARRDGPDSAAAAWLVNYNRSDVEAQAAIRDGLLVEKDRNLGK